MYNMDEFWKHDAEQRNLNTRNYILFHLCEALKTNQTKLRL